MMNWAALNQAFEQFQAHAYLVSNFKEIDFNIKQWLLVNIIQKIELF